MSSNLTIMYLIGKKNKSHVIYSIEQSNDTSN